ncbi:MAG: 1,4-dihydroxy-2-naphthoate polyprenyltransferase [Acidimicrobiales bacterium]
MATRQQWMAGARPRTLPAAVVPVGVGAGVGGAAGRFSWWATLLALVVAVGIQIGTNYANDYSDGIRGTDDKRVGPLRLVAGGIAPPRAVKRAAVAAFGVAALAGLALALATSPFLILVGLACIAAGWFYTGGPRPYGYAGLGELFVFVFFGLVAVVGTAYVNVRHWSALALLAGVPVGLLAVALLVVNNLRDLRSDGAAGKKTVAVRIGEERTRLLFAGCVVAAFAFVIDIILLRHFAWLALVAIVLATNPVRRVLRGESGRGLVSVLGMTGALQLGFGVLLTIGIVL